MGIATFPAPSSGKTRYVVTLLSGTSWTVPAGVTSINVKRKGGDGGDGQNGSGAGGAGGNTTFTGLSNAPGGAGGLAPGSPASTTQPGRVTANIYEDAIATTPGASITYAIGAAGSTFGATALQGFITIEWYV